MDPRISYAGLKEDFGNDVDLLSSLDRAKTMLHDHFKNEYASSSRTAAPTADAPGSAAATSSQPTEKVDFTARYRTKSRAVVDELEEYFKLPCEDFETCHPLKWWAGRRAQFPNLYCLARDIFSIPGMFEPFLSVINILICQSSLSRICSFR